MIRWQKYCFLLATLLVILAICYFTLESNNLAAKKTENSKKTSVEENLPEMEFHQTKLSEVVDEKVTWELNSQTVIMDQGKNKVIFQKSQGVFYEQGQKALTLQGDKGYFDLDTKNINLEGNVLVVSNKAEKIQAQKIQWVAARQKIQGQGQVIFVRGNTKVLGDRFEADLNLENVQITGNVRVMMGGN